MFRTIVMATDLSPAWDEIVSCAGELKALGCSEIILTHVVTVLFLSGMEGALRTEARQNLEVQKAKLEAQGFTVGIEIPTGLPAQSVNEVARCCGADLIVVGSQGRSLWREAVLGSVSSAMLHHIHYPTLLLNIRLKEGMAYGSCRLQATDLLRHVLYPADFSKISERAGEFVTRLAPQGISQVTVLHALDVPGTEDTYPPGYQEVAVGAARDLIEQWKQRLITAGIPVVHDRLDPGHPIAAILQVLASQDISLIVMGTQGKGFIKEIFLGSVAHNVSRLATCPVLLIPPGTR